MLVAVHLKGNPLEDPKNQVGLPTKFYSKRLPHFDGFFFFCWAVRRAPFLCHQNIPHRPGIQCTWRRHRDGAFRWPCPIGGALTAAALALGVGEWMCFFGSTMFNPLFVAQSRVFGSTIFCSA